MSGFSGGGFLKTSAFFICVHYFLCYNNKILEDDTMDALDLVPVKEVQCLDKGFVKLIDVKHSRPC
jgi:hypothetical protein